jgi:hypothetical protein
VQIFGRVIFGIAFNKELEYSVCSEFASELTLLETSRVSEAEESG